MARLIRVAVSTEVETVCPYTGTPDVSCVRIHWDPATQHNAQSVRQLVHTFAGRVVTAEDLALQLTNAVSDELECWVEVTVTQLQGHGVEASAETEWSWA